MDDPLRYLQEEIIQKAKALGYLLYDGTVFSEDMEHIPVAIWNTKDTWETFLQIGKDAGVMILYPGISIFSKEEIDEILELNKSKKNTFSQYSKYIGTFFQIEFSFFINSVMHVWVSDHPDWYSQFEELKEEAQILINEEREEKIDASIEFVAKELSKHPDFSLCKNKNQKIFLLRKLVRDDPEKFRVYLTADWRFEEIVDIADLYIRKNSA
jgi:hypothetical protein